MLEIGETEPLIGKDNRRHGPTALGFRRRFAIFLAMDTENDLPRPFPIPDSDEDLLGQCRIETFMAGGKGGQHQNRTESGVRLVHLPTGIVVTAREERSQYRNKATALSRLRQRLEAMNRRPPRRISTRVPLREKERRLQEKKRRGRVKDLRKKPPADGSE
jgi:ribosome-associated protein